MRGVCGLVWECGVVEVEANAIEYRRPYLKRKVNEDEQKHWGVMDRRLSVRRVLRFGSISRFRADRRWVHTIGTYRRWVIAIWVTIEISGRYIVG